MVAGERTMTASAAASALPAKWPAWFHPAPAFAQPAVARARGLDDPGLASDPA